MTDPYISQLTSATSISRPEPGHSGGETGAGTIVGGRYVLRVAVGTGGMGTVWRATDTQLNRQVAVKEVAPPLGIAPDDRDAMYQRMMREARAAAGLSHPSIVQVYDVVTDGDRPWVVMELLDARSLSEVVLQDGPLAPRAVAKIGVALLGALEVAHAAGVLHRDVKPANVLVCTDGRCVLTDFGVARMPSDQQLTTPGMVLGSPHFISPERAMGAPFGPPSDLFSVGVTLYLSVEGRPPFDRGEPIGTMHAVVEDPVPPPERAGPLTEVLYGLLEKDPARRWDAAMAREALRDLLAGPLASTSPQFPTDPYSVVPSQRLPWQPAAGERRVGGRALLSPSEAPTDRGTDEPASPAGAGADPDRAGQTVVFARSGGFGPGEDTYAGGQAAEDPYAAFADPYRHSRDAYYGESDPPAQGRSGGAGRAGTTASRAGATASRAGGAIGRVAGQVLAAIRRAPRPAQLAVAGSVVVLVLLVAVLFNAGDRDNPSDVAGGELPAPGQSPAPPDDEPLLEVEEYAGRGVVVNLPAGWRGLDNPDLVYIDFVDPADAGVAIRLLRENWNGEASGLVEFAEGTIAQSSGCADPYRRVALAEIEVAGRSAALLEYTCGSGDDMRRAKWATVVHDDTAYSFRLAAPDREFDDRSVIFDELVRSFRLAG